MKQESNGHDTSTSSAVAKTPIFPHHPKAGRRNNNTITGPDPTTKKAVTAMSLCSCLNVMLVLVMIHVMGPIVTPQEKAHGNNNGDVIMKSPLVSLPKNDRNSALNRIRWDSPFWDKQNMSLNETKENSTSYSGYLLPICTRGRRMGQDFNKLIEVTTLISLRTSVDQPIGLDTEFTEWYDRFIEPRYDDELKILRNYVGKCAASYDSRTLFDKRIPSSNYPEFRELVPRRHYRKLAEDYLAELRQSRMTNHPEDDLTIVTVHARRLDHGCKRRSQWAPRQCLTPPSIYNQTVTETYIKDAHCKLDFTIIKQVLFNSTQQQLSPSKTIVLLSTDNQNQQFDATFPIILRLPFPAACWLMVLSDVHYGNPLSTVDYGVAQWREQFRGVTDIRPRQCFVDDRPKQHQ